MGLFAHRFLDATATGYTPPCQPSEVKVNDVRLYEHLPVIALWYLRENDRISLTPVMKAGDFFVDFFQSYTTFAIEINRATQMSFPGLEHDLLEIIKSSETGVTTDTILMRFLGAKRRSVGSKFNGRLEDWLISLGYGQRKPPDTSPKPFFSIPKGNSSLYGDNFIPVCERIGAQEQAAQIIQRSWLKFRAEEREIFKYLYEDVRRAIAKCSLGGGAG